MIKTIKQPILILTLFLTFFFFRQIFFGEVIYCCDNLTINIPSKAFLLRELSFGHFPLWNPYILSGTPFLADINLALLYPLNVLDAFLSPFRALTGSIIISIFIALTGMYVLARSFKLSKFSALTAAIIFGFSGILVTYTNNIPLLQAASLLPWVFWSVYKYINNPSKDKLVVSASISTLQIFAGHPQITYLTWLLIVAYFFWFIFQKKNWIPDYLPAARQGAGMMSLLFLTFLLSAIQVLPFLEFTRLSSRTGFGFVYATFGSLNPLSLISLILPSIVGDLSRGTAWIQGGSVYGFVGALTLFIACFASLLNRTVKFFAAAAVWSLILAFGKYFPLYYLFYRIVPGLGSFRTPAHFLLIYTLSMAILAGFGVEEILKGRKYVEAKKIFLAGGSVGLFLALLLFVLGNSVNAANFHWLPGFLSSKVQSQTELREIILWSAENALITGILFTICSLAFKKYIWIITLAIFLELFLFARHGLLSVPYDRGLLWLSKSGITAEKLRPRGSGRMFVRRQLDFAPREKRFDLANYAEESAWQSLTLRTNLNMLYRLPTIDGYASMIYAPYAEFFAKKPSDPTGIDVQMISNSTLRLLGVGKVEEGNNERVSFRSLTTLGPVFIENNGQNTTTGILSSVWSGDKLSVKTKTTQVANLVSLTTNYPGWQVLVDGRPHTLGIYKNIFQKVRLPPGSHTVEFIFQPKSVLIGLILTVLGAIISLSIFLSAIINRKKLR